MATKEFEKLIGDAYKSYYAYIQALAKFDGGVEKAYDKEKEERLLIKGTYLSKSSTNEIIKKVGLDTLSKNLYKDFKALRDDLPKTAEGGDQWVQKLVKQLTEFLKKYPENDHLYAMFLVGNGQTYSATNGLKLVDSCKDYPKKFSFDSLLKRHEALYDSIVSDSHPNNVLNSK